MPGSCASFLLGVSIVICFGTWSSAWGQSGTSSEYNVKAAFLFHFSQFVEWPAEAFKDASAPSTYCTVGDDPFHGALDEILSGKTEGTRPLRVVHLRGPQEVRGCQVLFLGAGEKKRFGEALASVNRLPVLTVGETDHFVEEGSAPSCWPLRRRWLEIRGEIEMFYREASIQRKLTFVILVTSLLGLSLACMAFEVYERASYRGAMTSELAALADTLGANSTASLAFNDHQSALDILAALRAERHIVAACLYDKQGNLFAEYQRAGGGTDCRTSSLQEEGARYESESVTLYRSISLGGETAGAIAIISDLEALQAKIRQYTEISAVVIFASVVATFFVSSRLIRLITGPILQLAGIASRVSKQQDYALRAVSSGDDEVGTLIDSFNQMLERIQERDSALQTVKDELEMRFVTSSIHSGCRLNQTRPARPAQEGNDIF